MASLTELDGPSDASLAAAWQAGSEQAAADLVRAAIEMVHALRKQIVVEGVETQAQAALLSEWGCDAIQGYLLSQPVPAETFAALVRAQPTPALPPAESLVS